MSLYPIDYVFDSRDAIGGTSDKPTFVLPEALRDIEAVSLIYVNIPYVGYTVDGDIDTLVFSTATDPTITVRLDNVLLPRYAEGLHTLDVLCQRIQRAVQAVTGVVNNAFVTNFNCSYQAHTGLILMTSTVAFTLQVTVPSLASEVLGFPTTQAAVNASTSPYFDANNVLQTTGFYLRAPQPATPRRTKYMYLHSDIGPSVFEHIRSSYNSDTVMCGIPVPNQPFEQIVFQPQHPIVYDTTVKSLSQLTFWITQAERERYENVLQPGTYQPYMTLRGHSFQVGIRFWVRSREAVHQMPLYRGVPGDLTNQQLKTSAMQGIPRKRLRGQ